MPFSWVRISTHTSRKLRDCIGKDPTRVHAKECIEKLVSDRGGRATFVMFERNGKFARVVLDYPSDDEKAAIILDLEADEVIDLLPPDQLDELIAELERHHAEPS
jgi:hypothetical protein